MRIPDQTCSEYLISATLHIMVAKKSLVRHQAFDCIRTTIEPRTVSNSAVWEEGYFWIVFYLSQNLSSNSSDFFIHIEHKFLAQSLTMAEVLGTIASGISIAQLAGNLASSIIKFKSYWDQIQDAPDDIAFLVCEIESHHTILRSILEKQAQLTSSCHPTSGFFDQSIKLCHNASSELDGLVNALSKDINSNRKWKRTMSSANVLLMAEQLKKLKKRMKNATRSMHLAISWQMNTVLQQQSSTLTSNVQASLDHFLQHWQNHLLNSGLSQPTCSTKVSMNSAVLAQTINITMEAKNRLPVDHNFYEREPFRTMSHYNLSSWITFAFGSIGMQKIIKKNHKGAFQKSETVYHPPAWISRRAWQVMYTKDLSSLRWNINIQTCRTLDGDTAFFSSVVSGDILNVQRMLRERTGFVNDRFYCSSASVYFTRSMQEWVGATPLHVAAHNCHYNLCKLLLSANADVSAGDHCTGATPLQYLISSPCLNRNDNRRKTLEILRILVEGGAEEEFLGNSNFLEKTDMPVDIFSYIQHHTFLNEPLFAEKCKIAARIVEKAAGYRNTQQCIRSLLGGPKFSFYVGLHNNEKALQEVFQILCQNVTSFGIQKVKKQTNPSISKHPSAELLQELIGAQVPLHETGTGFTLLQRMICNCMFQTGINHRGRQILDWINLLHASGTDLEQYGETERSIFKMGRRNNFESLVFRSRINRVEVLNFEGPMKPVINYELGFSRLIDFTYGPCVEDWNFWFSEPTDRFAGDFWSLIEDPSLINLVPGAWVDKSLYNYSKTRQTRLWDVNIKYI
ncbi:uncharacterized protein EAE98_010527 [Botrytis deweyae]|uniref:Fungal N-terminal domain-containing protein n=1 Tax=Botrytis deweyae TaxID=2478750 RepID=A0ABQ7I8V2_9HELO|nr:uncharacterized protein EAE98_010527 [Botrytis deweyae]KAF7916805.1 hypothetical protein EAE98_010527 [Botrytis deweyae]